MTHAIPADCAEQLGGMRLEDPSVLVGTDKHGPFRLCPWHPLFEGGPPIPSHAVFSLPQSFAALARILARHVGMPPDGDNVPRWTWYVGCGAWSLQVGGTRPARKLWSFDRRAGCRWAPLAGLGSSVVARDRAEVDVERRQAFGRVFVWEARLARATDVVRTKRAPPWDMDATLWTPEDLTRIERENRREPWSLVEIP